MPKGAVTTGWPAVRKKCGEFGIRFRPWQEGAGRIILSKRDDGKYAATIGGTGLSIPRQVGKTFLVGAIVFALCLIFPNLTVIWTAHRVRTAEETFGKMQAFAKRKGIKPHILKVVLGSGEEAILFRNGSRILFGAREGGFGLGFDEVDVLIFDEAQRLTEVTLDDMIPATNQSRQPTGALLFFMGTPPRPTDRGEVFTRMRTEALAGDDDDTAWIELGCDPGYEPTEAPAPMTAEDWRQIAKANPSFPDDTPRESILRMRKQLGHESMVREGYGRWDEDDGDAFEPGAWRNAALEEGDRPHAAAIGLAVSVDRQWSSIASVGEWDDGSFLLGAVERRRGTAWLVDEAKRIQDEHRCVVIIDAKGPAESLLEDLETAGVQVVAVPTEEYLSACGSLYDAVVEKGTATHMDDTELNQSVRVAAKRAVGDRWVWARRKSAGDISMLEAATLAWRGREETLLGDPSAHWI